MFPVLFACLTNANTKVVLLILAILLGGSNAFAQKKNVNRAKAKLLAEVPDTKGAQEAILPALKDSTTKNLASTWFTAGEVYNAIFEEQQKKQWTTKNGDQNLMGESLANALNAYVKADSLDRLPNEKGKVKPKFTNKIVDRTMALGSG